MPASNILRSKMVEKGITATALANMIGMSKTALSKRINGNVPFRDKEIRSIKQALNLTSQDLVLIFFA